MPHLSTKDGRLVGGVYGFMVLALEIVRRLKPDYVCVAWDKSKTNIRSRQKLYPEYKANRKSAPPDFYQQIPILFDLLEAFNWPLYEIDDYEADDIMATLADKAEKKEDLETILISSDLDLLQALGKNTKIYINKRGFTRIKEYGVDDFESEYEIKFEQFIDYKALMGDSSDNIPGVAGIGPKGATTLLQTYQDLEDIYNNLKDIKPAWREKLQKGKDMAFLSRKLVTLQKDAPLDLDLETMKMVNLDKAQLQAKLRDLEFFSLLKKLPDELIETSVGLVTESGLGLAHPKIISHNSLEALGKLDLSKPIFCKSYCKQRFGRQPLGFIATDNPKNLHFFPPSGQSPKQLTIYGYGTKPTVQALLRLGANKVDVSSDVLLTAFLLNSQQPQPQLSDLAQNLGYIGELDDLSFDDWRTKAPDIFALVTEIKKLQTKELEANKALKNLAAQVEHPLISVIARLEMVGIGLDLEVLDELEVSLKAKIKELQDLIYGYAGLEFNLASPAQLADVLFTKLKLSTQNIKKTRRGYSTDSEQLEKLIKLHPIIDCVRGWREYTKLLNTYVLSLRQHYYRGRVHTNLQMTVVPTGRLSSTQPNLQNIPIRSEVGRLVRRAFVTPDKRSFVNADYSQFELRLAAFLAKDSEMIEVFAKNQDIHIQTASQIFGVDAEKVSSDQRYAAKAINFGILYGQGPRRLAQQTGLSFSQAQKFIEKYFQTRPALKKYLDGIKKSVIKKGYIETLLGRRRFVPQSQVDNLRLRETALRQAINTPIQGTAADLMKLAMIELDRRLDSDCQQIMQVHDSILVECPTTKTSEVADLMKAVMENIYPDLGVNLLVETMVGRCWAEV